MTTVVKQFRGSHSSTEDVYYDGLMMYLTVCSLSSRCVPLSSAHISCCCVPNLIPNDLRTMENELLENDTLFRFAPLQKHNSNLHYFGSFDFSTAATVFLCYFCVSGSKLGECFFIIFFNFFSSKYAKK